MSKERRLLGPTVLVAESLEPVAVCTRRRMWQNTARTSQPSSGKQEEGGTSPTIPWRASPDLKTAGLALWQHVQYVSLWGTLM